MKKYGKVLMLALVAALILASCGESAATADSTAADTTAADTTPAETDYYTNIPDGTDFGGKTFNIISYAQETSAWQIYIAAETENGDLLNDAAYRRNREVEELLNITVSETLIPGTAAHESTFKNSVLAGDNAYDVICY